MIKSALEIAMEKTKDLKVDSAALAKTEARNEGKRLAGSYLNNPEDCDLGKSLAALPKDRREEARMGAFEVFAARVQLPLVIGQEIASELQLLAGGLKQLNTALMGEKKIQATFDEIGGFLSQYVENAKQLDDNLRKQYAPRLKQKEQELSMRMGRPVHLDPMQDPEFSAIYKQHVGQLKGQYQQALDGVKAELAALCGIRLDSDS